MARQAPKRRGGSTDAITVGGVAGALVTVGIWAAQQRGVNVPATLAAPLTTLVSALGLGIYFLVCKIMEPHGP
jgi:hypothetical protein